MGLAFTLYLWRKHCEVCFERSKCEEECSVSQKILIFRDVLHHSSVTVLTTVSLLLRKIFYWHPAPYVVPQRRTQKWNFKFIRGASIKITVLWELCRVVSWKLKDVSDALTASIIRARSRLKKQDSLGLGQYLAAPMDKGEGEDKRPFLIGILTRYYSIWNVQNPFTKK